MSARTSRAFRHPSVRLEGRRDDEHGQILDAAPSLEEVREVVTQELASLLGYVETAPAGPETLHTLLRDASKAEDIAT